MKYNFTIDQIYLFYEKCKRQEMDLQKSHAVTLANALIFTSPYSDKNKSQREWNKFIQSLTWENLEKQSKIKTLGGVKNMFSGAGIPMKKKEKKGDN